MRWQRLGGMQCRTYRYRSSKAATACVGFESSSKQVARRKSARPNFGRSASAASHLATASPGLRARRRQAAAFVNSAARA
eukprot:scaffold23107_cov28-Tisochrysis_lutea.AAC.3